MILDNHQKRSPLKVLVIGCGLGGLSCAISCLRAGLEVEVVERAKELKEIGAGIQLPPNAVRIMAHYGLVEQLIAAGAVELQENTLARYSDGVVLAGRPDLDFLKATFGQSYYVMHRADYHQVLYKETIRLGAKMRLDCDVLKVDCETPCATTALGDRIYADVVVGADGLHSIVRDQVLGHHEGPVETGDLAYRGTIPKSLIEGLNDRSIQSLLDVPAQRVWIGPNQHAVLYPVKNRTVYNLVLLAPDDLPKDTAISQGDIGEMRSLFRGWDPRLTAIIACIDSVLKWRICHMHELDSWVKGSVALLGDSCHPTLPYQAQGAAMAVEDGAVLGIILGSLYRSPFFSPQNRKSQISAILHLYESLRKRRTTTNVQGSAQNRILYHMTPGPERDVRDEALRNINWFDPQDKCDWSWGDLQYQKNLMGFDAITDATAQFERWAKKQMLEVSG